MSDHADASLLRGLFEIASGRAAGRDPGTAFDDIPGAARDLTGARYSALGVLNKQRHGLERFHTAGMDKRAHGSIGHAPRGRGVLGALVRDPQPLRLDDVASDPSGYGFPDGHPVMHSFLGVSIGIGEVVWGNLYVADKKAGGSFSDADREVAVVLAQCAANAIEWARSQPARERSSEFWPSGSASGIS